MLRVSLDRQRVRSKDCDSPGLTDSGGEPKTQAGGSPMSTKERKPPRTLDQDFIDTPMERSAVLLVGQAMLGNGGGR